ncbi:MAG: hypothetical protein JSR54_02785 [Proteobacteria bacterium]|nr:hypothetical protein [Pseudomonadota bacterium]
MSDTHHLLVFGASYGSLLGLKCALAGHAVTLVCLPEEAKLINDEGAVVRMPIKGREGLVEINSRAAPGRLTASGTTGLDLGRFDLVALAMQEPQYRSPGVRELLAEVAQARLPCLSIMNMPPLPYLRRIPGVDADACRACYADPGVWDPFDPACLTLCSPDPQAFRPPGEKVNVLQVRLPTNFKAARFASDAHTAILRRLEADIDAVRLDTGSGRVEVPVKLRVHDSVFVPLAKWAMLIAGNYRCIGRDGMRSIRDAVHGDIGTARATYEWVVAVCERLGADRADLVPFDKYAAAAQGLASPSSAARALFGGAPAIERVDRLVQAIAAQVGMRSAVLDEIVGLVDARLEQNRKARA